MENKPRKSGRLDLTPASKKEPRKPSGDDADSTELKLDELEERVTPRPIGTFF